MTKPSAFYSYLENGSKLNILSDEQAGRLYKSLYAYARTGEKPDLSDDPLVAYAFEDFIIDVDRDFDNYSEKCAKRSESGKRGGAPKGNQNASKNNQNNQNNQNKQMVVLNKQNKQTVVLNNQKQPKTSKTSETEAETEIEEDYKEEKINKKEEIQPVPMEKFYDDTAMDVVNEFNRICIDLPEVTKLTDQRRRLLFHDGMMDKSVDDYTKLFKRVHASDKLCGRSGINWRADFEWVIKNSVKIMEGSYDNVEPKGKPPNKQKRMYSVAGASFDMDRWKGNVPEGCG